MQTSDVFVSSSSSQTPSPVLHVHASTPHMPPAFPDSPLWDQDGSGLANTPLPVTRGGPLETRSSPAHIGIIIDLMLLRDMTRAYFRFA